MTSSAGVTPSLNMFRDIGDGDRQVGVYHADLVPNQQTMCDIEIPSGSLTYILKMSIDCEFRP